MARRETKEEKGPGIVVLYTALMILLLAFFILLNAMGKTEEAKVEAAIQSMRSAFGLLSGGDSPLGGEQGRPASEVSPPVLPVDQDYRYLRGLVRSLALDKEVSLLRSETSRTVVMTGALLFDRDSVKLSPQGQEFLRMVAEAVKGDRYPISFYGHTDSTALADPQGRDNWYISAERALAVLRFLVGLGVDPKRLAAFGMAGFQPRVTDRNPEHHRLNDRVEMVFDARDPALETITAPMPEPKVGFRGFIFDLLPQEGK
ncbi:MAG: OmpA family protein [Pseudomonadota bacterium]